jgi:hypothetical protein
MLVRSCSDNSWITGKHEVGAPARCDPNGGVADGSGRS